MSLQLDDISVIIPVCISDDDSLSLLAEILGRLGGGAEHLREIIIVDDKSSLFDSEQGSHDSTSLKHLFEHDAVLFGSAEIKTIKNKVTVLEPAEKLYSAGARNAGAAAASGRLLFFLDSDVLPPLDLFEQLNRLAGSGSGTTGDGHGHVYSAWQLYYDGMLLDGHQALATAYKHYWVYRQYHCRSGQAINWIFSACYLIERDLFNRFGGYLAGTQSRDASDEIALTARLDVVDYRALVVGVRGIRHMKRYTTASLLKNDRLRAAAQTSFAFDKLFTSRRAESKASAGGDDSLHPARFVWFNHDGRAVNRRVLYHIRPVNLLSIALAMIGWLGVLQPAAFFGWPLLFVIHLNDDFLVFTRTFGVLRTAAIMIGTYSAMGIGIISGAASWLWHRVKN